MARNKRGQKNLAQQNNKKTNVEEGESSPFAAIVLREAKKEEKRQPVVKPKKPSEIVQGYNPKADFADILYNWEHTGNPYALPTQKRQAEIKSAKTDFATIFAQWEGKSAPKKKEEAKRASEPYKATKSFAEILDSFEGKSQPKQDTPAVRKEEPKPKAPTFFREMEEDDEIPQGVSWSVFSGSQNIERPTPAKDEIKAEAQAQAKTEKKSTYKATKSFAEILDSFEGKAKPQPQPQPQPQKTEEATKEEAEPIRPTTSLFKEMEEDDEIPSTVSWSVFSGPQEIERVKEEMEPEPKDESEAKDEAKQTKEDKPSYVASRSFADILSEYESTRPVTSQIEAPAEEKEVPQTSNLFKEMDEDDEIPAEVSWSVFGGAQNIERPKAQEMQPVIDLKPTPKARKEKPRHVKVEASPTFRKEVEKVPVKSFDEILEEKGDLAKLKKVRTMNELRIMLPQSTLDLHGMTQAEAESALRSFIGDAMDAGLEKVAIIHGKGLHSEDGVGVLRDVTMHILSELAVSRETSQAKPAYGGAGVTWVILKRKDSN